MCGNGILESGEACDDGNLVAGDGCDPNCNWEATCGNGIVEPGEDCDDGNLVSGDDCSSSCDDESAGGLVRFVVRTDTGHDTLVAGVPGSIVFSVYVDAGQNLAALVWPLKYTFTNGNIIGPINASSGNAYYSVSAAAQATFESIGWNTNYGQSATDPDSTLFGAIDFNQDGWQSDGEVWRLTFTPMDTGTITIDSATLLPANELDAFDQTGASVPFTWEPFTLHVISGYFTGDVNSDSSITSADVIELVNYTFKGGTLAGTCEAVADVNCSGVVTAGDLVKLVNYVFKSGAQPCNAGGLIQVGVWDCQ
jgi:cysteine-rich repeat protein